MSNVENMRHEKTIVFEFHCLCPRGGRGKRGTTGRGAGPDSGTPEGFPAAAGQGLSDKRPTGPMCTPEPGSVNRALRGARNGSFVPWKKSRAHFSSAATGRSPESFRSGRKRLAWIVTGSVIATGGHPEKIFIVSAFTGTARGARAGTAPVSRRSSRPR